MTDPRESLAHRLLSAVRMPTVSPAAVEELARREFTVSLEGDLVVAVVTGAGELVRLEISATLTRGDGREQLGPLVVQAVNLALDEVDRARRELLPAQGDAIEALDKITDAFSARMDGLLGRLDEIGRRLPPEPS